MAYVLVRVRTYYVFKLNRQISRPRHHDSQAPMRPSAHYSPYHLCRYTLCLTTSIHYLGLVCITTPHPQITVTKPHPTPNPKMLPTDFFHSSPADYHAHTLPRYRPGILQLTKSSLTSNSSTSFFSPPTNATFRFDVAVIVVNTLNVSLGFFRPVAVVGVVGMVLVLVESESLSLRGSKRRTDFGPRGRDAVSVQPSPPENISSMHSSAWSSPAWSCQDAARVRR